MRSLALKFALVSLIPVLVLGWVLNTTTRTSITSRTTELYGATTSSVVRLGAAALFRPPDFLAGSRIDDGRRKLIDDFLLEIGADGSSVRVLVVDPEGRAVYSNYGVAAGTRIPLVPSIRTALGGRRVTSILDGRDSVTQKDTDSTPVETALPVEFGDETVHGAIIASGLDTDFVDDVNGDIARLRTILAVGLSALWLSLLPIVLSVSRRLRRQVDENEHLAMHDGLTGLPNRNLLHDRLDTAIAVAQRSGRLVALLLIDLDRFKEVNDTLGHAKGDELLQHVGTVLRDSARVGDTVARLGGDEFAIVVNDVTDEAEIIQVLERVTASLANPLAIEGIDIAVEASIGVAVYPTHASSPSHLLQHADVAMYASKEADVDYAFYRGGDEDAATPSRLELAADLRRALTAADQIVLHYQPVASPADGRIVGVEALVRWEHPHRGLLAPERFIPLAEQSGLIRLLTRYVLERAVAQGAAWRAMGLDISVGVNLSARDLRDSTILRDVRDVLTRHDLPADRLELEMTETAMLASPEAAFSLAADLLQMGAGLALDDFGTGYSSLTYLKRLRPTRIKIDRTFVEAMTDDAADEAIVRCAIRLGHELGISVTAEGVETSEQWELLRNLDCDLVQGYLLSRPMPADVATDWLLARQPVTLPAAAGTP